MEDVNKVFSLILGLIVVILFFAVVTGKINLGHKLSSLFAKKGTVTNNKQVPSPSPTPISQLSIINKKKNEVQDKINETETKEIPSTGLPTEVLLSLYGAIPIGFFLRKTKE